MLYKQAEFENFRKRTLKEKADLILNGGEKTVKAILPILDDFERAITLKGCPFTCLENPPNMMIFWNS